MRDLHGCRRQFRRCGAVQRPLLAAAALVVVLLATVWVVYPPRQPPLFVYCAAGSREPLEKIAASYEREYRQRVELQSAGSGTLLTGIDLSRAGDVLVCADERYIDDGRAKGLLAQAAAVATQRPVLVVAKGNPLKIASLRDLEATRVRLALANPELDGISAVVRDQLEAGQWDRLAARVTVFDATVKRVAEEIQAGKADAGFVWTPIARLHAGSLEIVELPELKDVTARVSAAVLRTSQQPENADRFVRFVASPEGSRVFAELGFGPVKAAP